MRIPVFYTPKMVANIESFSPSAGKPGKVVESWRQLGIPMDIIEPAPASTGQLCLAHDPDFVNSVLACVEPNGFGNTLPHVADSLLYTVGSMISASREAIKNRSVAVAPCSGFHHAGYDLAQAFCTFNGLVVAAQVIKKEQLANKVGILDFDHHYGNGTDEIMQELSLGSWIKHYTAGKVFYSKAQVEQFMLLIPKVISGRMKDCDLIIYQAGADPHVNDPYGGWLTTQQLAERDLLVFSVAKRMGIPIAWNLAGGYQTDRDGGIRPVLDIHDNTMKACYEIYQ